MLILKLSWVWPNLQGKVDRVVSHVLASGLRSSRTLQGMDKALLLSKGKGLSVLFVFSPIY